MRLVFPYYILFILIILLLIDLYEIFSLLILCGFLLTYLRMSQASYTHILFKTFYYKNVKILVLNLVYLFCKEMTVLSPFFHRRQMMVWLVHLYSFFANF